MKKLTTFIKPYQLDKIIHLLTEEGIVDIYFQEIKNYNLIQNNFLPRIKLDLYLHSEELDKAKKLILNYKSNDIIKEAHEESFETWLIHKYIDISSGEIFIFP